MRVERPAADRSAPARTRGRATPEFLLLAVTVAFLLMFGLVMAFSASFVASTAEYGDAFSIFRRQALWCGIGLAPMVFTALADYRRWRRFAVPLLVVTLLACLLVVIPGVGIENNGARRWLGVGAMTFQPAEAMKLGVLLFLADMLARRWPLLRAGDLRALLLPAGPLLAFAVVLIMAEPDLETAVLLIAVVGVVLYTAGLPIRLVLTGGLGTVLLGAVGIAARGFRQGRLSAWLDPFSDPSAYGYQTLQGYYALGSGGWVGTGLGQGRSKWLYLPNAHTDFIFAIIGEELGLFGALVVLGLYTVLAIAGVRTARCAPDPFGRLLAVGITAWILLQAAINIGSVVGLLPVTGVTLPLVSVGGTSLVITMIALGLLLSIARHARSAPPHRRTARPAEG